MRKGTVCLIRLFRGLGGGGVKLGVLWLGLTGLLSLMVGDPGGGEADGRFRYDSVS